MANPFGTFNAGNDTDDNDVVNRMANNAGVLNSNNEESLQHSDVSIIDNNTVFNNTQRDSLPSPKK